ncbi:hypothetical protein KIPB_015188, partial [Kipferlia bialata]|eukprot:g15188.t1
MSGDNHPVIATHSGPFHWDDALA